MKHVDDNVLLTARQSAYRCFHSTETVIAAVHNDLIRAADADHVTALVLLDLSSTFETVDHDILLSVLERRFGVDGVALSWFQSYLQGRTQTFIVNGNSSTTHRVNCSVPQGSALGPTEFISYTESVTSIFGCHNINHHLFADDKQAYASTLLEGVDDVRGRLRDCTTDISNWCASRRLQLNENKTEMAWFGKRSRLNKLANMEQTVTVGASVIKPAAVLRDLGVLFDQELSMIQHIARVTSSCFYQLRRLRQIRRPVGKELVAQLVHSFVLSRIDYGNSVLAGLPKSTIMPLQRVQNAAARLILDLRMSDHVTPALKQLHWLPVDRRVEFKLCTMMHSIHTGQCPTYSADMVRAVAANQTRSGLRSANTARYQEPRCRTEIGKRAFSYAGPHAWNTLPSSLHNITDSKQFRKQLKTLYFTRAFI